MENDNVYEKVLKVLDSRFRHLGFEESHDAILIGKAPHIGKLAWLHKFFRGLDDKEIVEIETRLGIKLPSQIKNFYSQSNGLKLFTNVLSFDGIRRINSRDPFNHEPFNIYTPNLHERLLNSKETHFNFGSYGYDLTNVYIDTESGKVHACDRRDAAKIKSSWATFNLFLESEMYRLLDLFDENGIYMHSSQELTIPTQL